MLAGSLAESDREVLALLEADWEEGGGDGRAVLLPHLFPGQGWVSAVLSVCPGSQCGTWKMKRVFRVDGFEL